MLGLGVGFYKLGVNDNATPFHPKHISDIVALFDYRSVFPFESILSSADWLNEAVAQPGGTGWRKTGTGTHPLVELGNGFTEYPGKIVFSNAGTVDELSFTQGNTGTSITLDTSDKGYTIFLVASGGNRMMAGGSSGTSSSITSAVGGGGASAYALKAGNVQKIFTVDSYTGQSGDAVDGDDVCSIMFVAQPNGNTTLFLDNVAQADTETNTADFVFDKLGGVDFAGSYYYVIMYDKAVTVAEGTKLYNYVKHLLEKA